MLKKHSHVLSLLTLLTCLPVAAWADNTENTDLIERGRRIYQDGIIGSGKELEGSRSGNIELKGAAAACVTCHRRSGMGSVEGDTLIEPITGNYLFHPDNIQVSNMNPRSGKKFNQIHPAYTESTLATAIATGMNNSGRQMQALMPNYSLDKQDMAALSAYLQQLSATWSAGIEGETIHLATVITPEVDAARRKAFLDTLNLAVIQKNGGTSTASNKKGRRHMASAAEMVLGTERKWQLHVWELQGTSDTWAAQLAEKLTAQPVFAVLSGVSDSTWQPVHNFCETNHIPCWFPSVVLPETTQSFYGLYFSRGVLLEADVLAKTLVETQKPKHVIQIYRDEIAATAAAKRLSELLTKADIAIEDRVIKPDAELSLGKLTEHDTVIFWLHGNDLEALNKLPLPKVKALYFSGTLTGDKLSKAWRTEAQLVYPYQLPDKRAANLTNFYAWQRIKKLPIVDEPLQAEAFFAVEFLTETLTEMLDNLYRDYLVERAESMLSRSEAMKSEQQLRERQLRSRIGLAAPQQSTSMYPRLGLGVDQRFASKGAYIVHYDKAGQLTPVSDWLVP